MSVPSRPVTSPSLASPSDGATSSTPAAASVPDASIYEGRDTHCSCCSEEYASGQRVLRLRCGHVFHAHCWERYHRSVLTRDSQDSDTPPSGDMRCPNCRGPAHIIAIWKYIEIETPTQQIGGVQAENLLGTPEGELHVDHLAVFDHPSSHESRLSNYHINTRLRDGRPSIIIDPGSVGNLARDKWCKEVAREASRHGYKPRYERRTRSLSVSGVGNGSQECHFDCELPIALQKHDENDISVGTITTPTVSGSELPGLLGLQALKKNRSIIDMTSNKIYFVGPGDFDLMKALPPGTECYQCEEAPSGHLVLPICEFNRNGAQKGTIPEHSLTLVTKPKVTPVAAMPSPSQSSWTPPVLNVPPPPPPYTPTLPVTQELAAPATVQGTFQ